MARTATQQQEKATGERFRDARRQSGLSGVEAAYRVRRFVPKHHQLGYATISRIENDLTREEDLDTVFVVGLARVYKIELVKLSPLHAQRADDLAALITEGLEYAPRDSNPEPSVSLSVVEQDFPRGTWN